MATLMDFRRVLFRSLFQTIIINIEESTMNNRILLVVGDKFASYVKSKDAITVSQLRGLLSLPVHMLPGQSRTVLVPGQGMGDDCVQQLLSDASVSPNIAHFDFSLWHNLPQRASSALDRKSTRLNSSHV